MLLFPQVYDLCDANSFDKMIFWWEKFLERQIPQKLEVPMRNVPMIVVGNKLDIAGKGRSGGKSNRSVKAKQWCEESGGIPYFEVFIGCNY
jgi:hypothetical protein